MTKQIREYLAYISSFMAQQHTDDELRTERGRLLKRIKLYQHERLIHLMVTLAFALLFMISFALVIVGENIFIAILSVLFLGLLIPYIRHYFFLENSVQRLYLYYYELEKI